MSNKYFLDKYNLSLKNIIDENAILKKEIETLKKKESIYNNKMLYTYARFHEYKKDTENALKYYKLSADQGHLLSQCQIITIYQYKKDLKNAMNYLLCAANNTQTISGHIYDIEDYIKIDSEAILRCYTPFADKGNIMFQCIIAIIYKYKNDIENALKYYKLAADRGMIFAQFQVANIYRYKNDSKNFYKYYKLIEDKDILEATIITKKEEDDNEEKSKIIYSLCLNYIKI